MNASFGRHSGRGNRRENYYKFKRQDSSDSLKINEYIRKSGENNLRDQHGSGGRNPHQKRQLNDRMNPQTSRNNDYRTIEDTHTVKLKNNNSDMMAPTSDYDY